jgi:hypothetical protein
MVTRMLNFSSMFLGTQRRLSFLPIVCYLFLTFFVTSNDAVRSHDMIISGQKLAPDAQLLNAANHPNTLVLLGTKRSRDDYQKFFKVLQEGTLKNIVLTDVLLKLKLPFLVDGHHLTFHDFFDSASRFLSLEQKNVPLYHNILLCDITSSNNKMV